MSTNPKPRALITGASAGIGAAFARRLFKDGYDLILVARDKSRLAELAQELGGAQVIAADLSDPGARPAVEAHITSGPPLTLLVNNAGFGTVGAFAELDMAREEQEVQLNVLALMRLARAALPGMIREGKGSIINVSSMAGFNPGPRNATYCATKAFVTSFSESIYEELRGTGVKVQALCPGFTRTEFQARAEVNTSNIPEAAWMSAEDVVDASLRALERDQAVCIPGTPNKAALVVTGILPRGIVRRLMGRLSKNF